MANTDDDANDHDNDFSPISNSGSVDFTIIVKLVIKDHSRGKKMVSSLDKKSLNKAELQ